MPTTNINVGSDAFPRLKSLSDDQVICAGRTNDSDALLNLDQFIYTASSVCKDYEGELTAEELLSSTIKLLSE
jgi:hypothetical protein